eukprot:CAMPEP_0194782192 /NCGR_PEP_ID=MMETSP0323_2-20130528/78341_1 /TAXON_ID=2866 ORGANISM="Crypthecodinium cohnii, Strain Seligo" /NCGR_SAMPLE_ID=MMETSP0323_2 /ASSEMBLY_ACC=CAM_ASM_000346 /LENGTH=109 /DNA_ID=CAMNT_0039720955 /DNA_START=457 /DNA_END=785 /DNA_ORIENTATION=+
MMLNLDLSAQVMHPGGQCKLPEGDALAKDIYRDNRHSPREGFSNKAFPVFQHEGLSIHSGLHHLCNSSWHQADSVAFAECLGNGSASCRDGSLPTQGLTHHWQPETDLG